MIVKFSNNFHLSKFYEVQYKRTEQSLKINSFNKSMEKLYFRKILVWSVPFQILLLYRNR
ncbi:hypothetical protein BpHYR1_037306 [Brachionus plicatilis]|uniref:Uncharacterized protein n=1 Tax=Brachionus plicatilis TaxID=10195 RepID=A0A3M7RYH2_BRAPC|nr:hypothetical protein BpHYR1_037306 [Brachionus plicatilis]